MDKMGPKGAYKHPLKSAKKVFLKKDVNNYQKKIESELLNDYKKGYVCNLCFFYYRLRNCECKDK
jgi:hypothetical protein